MDLENIELGIVLDAVTIGWWLYLVVICLIARRLIGHSGITTFTFFLPYLVLTNGVLVPVAPDFAFQLTGMNLTIVNYSSYWWSLALMYACLLIGIALANLCSKPPVADQARDRLNVLRHPKAAGAYVWLVFALAAGSLLQIYAMGLNFDLLSYITLKMDYDAYAAHRYGFAEATQGIDFWLYNKLPYGIAPLAVIFVWNAKEWDGWKRVAFTLIVALALFQTGHKMPSVFLLAYIVMSRAIIARQFTLGRKMVRTTVVLGAVVILGVVPAFYMFQGSLSYGNSLFWSVERIFVEQARVLQVYFECWPDYHPFLHGASNATIAALMGVSDFVPPPLYIANEFLGLENTSFPALIIGEGWADFGYYGVALISVAAGFILQLYNRWFYSLPRPSLEDSALFLAIVFGTYHLFASGLLTAMFSYGLLGNLVIYKLIKQAAVLKLEAPRADDHVPVAR